MAQPRDESAFAGKHLGKGYFLLKKKHKKVMVSQLPLNTGTWTKAATLLPIWAGTKSKSENFRDTVISHLGTAYLRNL